MADIDIQRTADRAYEKAEAAHSALLDVQRELKFANEELGYLRTFSLRLLAVLKLQLHLSDAELDQLVKQTAGAQDRMDEKPGTKVAPLCAFCHRPLQEDSENCIYCGRKPA
jgi:hypothetical protein